MYLVQQHQRPGAAVRRASLQLAQKAQPVAFHVFRRILRVKPEIQLLTTVFGRHSARRVRRREQPRNLRQLLSGQTFTSALQRTRLARSRSRLARCVFRA